MIAAIQTQDVVAVAPEQLGQYVFVEDSELIHVGGGGTSTGYF